MDRCRKVTLNKLVKGRFSIDLLVIEYFDLIVSFAINNNVGSKNVLGRRCRRTRRTHR